MQWGLNPLTEIRDHKIVTQIVKPKFIIGAVRDVRSVGLKPGTRTQMLETLVLSIVERIKQK